MVRDSKIPPDSFSEILAWLDADREVAAEKYLRLRKDLHKVFMWEHCLDPEGLTDEAIDRVATNIHELRQSYKGDPLRYFHGVAKNLIKEHRRFIKTQATLDDSLEDKPTETNTEILQMQEECFDSCLNKLSPERRDLILSYYAENKQAKIDHRTKMARDLGLSAQALRVKTYRIRSSLEQCIKQCLRRKQQGK